jgi:hypothetical protein
MISLREIAVNIIQQTLPMQELYGVDNVGYFINEVTLIGRLAPDQPPVDPVKSLKLMQGFTLLEVRYNDYHTQCLQVDHQDLQDRQDRQDLVLTYPIYQIVAEGLSSQKRWESRHMRLDQCHWLNRVNCEELYSHEVGDLSYLVAMVAPGSAIHWPKEGVIKEPNPIVEERRWEGIQSVRLGSRIIRKIYLELATKYGEQTLDSSLVVPDYHLPQYADDFLAIDQLPGDTHGYAWRIPTAPIVSVLSRWSWNQLPDYYKAWIMVAGIRYPMSMQQRQQILDAIPIGPELDHCPVIRWPDNLFKSIPKVTLDIPSQCQARDRFRGIMTVRPVAAAPAPAALTFLFGAPAATPFPFGAPAATPFPFGAPAAHPSLFGAPAVSLIDDDDDEATRYPFSFGAAPSMFGAASSIFGEAPVPSPAHAPIAASAPAPRLVPPPRFGAGAPAPVAIPARAPRLVPPPPPRFGAAAPAPAPAPVAAPARAPRLVPPPPRFGAPSDNPSGPSRVRPAATDGETPAKKRRIMTMKTTA